MPDLLNTYTHIHVILLARNWVQSFKRGMSRSRIRVRKDTGNLLRSVLRQTPIVWHWARV